jgi:hypothetical protein
MSRVRQVARRLGKSGIAFLVFLALYLAFYFSGHDIWAITTLLVLLPLGFFVAFRALRRVQRRLLWGVRNRLLFAYGLMGVLPILLLFVLIGLSVWGLTNDLAIYLASSALERRLDPINGTVAALERMGPEQRAAAAAEMQRAFNGTDLIAIRPAAPLSTFPSIGRTRTVSWSGMTISMAGRIGPTARRKRPPSLLSPTSLWRIWSPT